MRKDAQSRSGRGSCEGTPGAYSIPNRLWEPVRISAVGRQSASPSVPINNSITESKRRAVADVAALLFPSVPPREGQQGQRQESFN